MDDFDEELDMDLLAGLLDDDDPEIAHPSSTVTLNGSLEKSPVTSTALGLDLSDDECNENGPSKSASSSFCDAFSTANSSENRVKKRTVKAKAPQPVDPLELELSKMEQRMTAIKAELSKKKNLSSNDSDSPRRFTKLTYHTEVKETQKKLSAEEKSSLLKRLKDQKRSIVHGGETDSEDDEDNRNPFETRYNDYGRSLKKNLGESQSGYSSRNKFTDSSPVTSSNQSSCSGFGNTQSTLKSLDIKRQEVAKKIKNGDGWQSTSGSLVAVNGNNSSMTPAEKNAVRCPYSGLFVVSPTVTASMMEDRMEGRRHICLSTIPLHLRGGDIEGDWVTIAVLVSKSQPKTSQKGTQYSVWQVSDLRDCTKTVGLFLFSGAHSGLWKTTVGSVVALLNAQVMKDRQGESSSNLVTLSVNNSMSAMVMGTSRDLGWCKGRTKANGICRQFVNKSVCEFCVYHVQREYQKTSAKRADLQSSFSTGGPSRKALQAKVLGKDQVFYGGKLYTGSSDALVPSKQKPAHKAKDLATLSSLKMKLKSDNLKVEDRKKSFVLKHLSSNEVSVVQTMVKGNDSLGERLLAPTPGARNLLRHKTQETEQQQREVKEAKGIAVSLTAKDLLKMTHTQALQRKAQQTQRLQSKERLNASPLTSAPTLGRGFSPGQAIDLDFSPPSKRTFDPSKANCSPSSKRPFDPAKAKALAILKRKGETLKSSEKNDTRNKDKTANPEFKERIQKRLRDENGSGDETPSKKQKDDRECRSLLGSVDLNADKIQAMLEKKSRHSNLVDEVEDQLMEKYYNKLEMKEKLEEKLTSTMEVATSAVVCTVCKYQAVIQSQFCKDEGHVVKPVKAHKRFFECSKCKKRTVTLEKMPGKSCGNCAQTSWRRVAMGKERKGPTLDSEVLCLRGNEQKHYGGLAEKSYLHIEG